MSQQLDTEIRELRERLDRVQKEQAPSYDPPFLARVWLFCAVLVTLGVIGAAAAWII
jgi:hypothetical protein